MTKKKSDQEKFLAGVSAIAKGLAIGAVVAKQSHDIFEELFEEIWGDEEEAIASEPTPRKQLPPAAPARRRRKNG